jgi:hypothetical protein
MVTLLKAIYKVNGKPTKIPIFLTKAGKNPKIHLEAQTLPPSSKAFLCTTAGGIVKAELKLY